MDYYLLVDNYQPGRKKIKKGGYATPGPAKSVIVNPAKDEQFYRATGDTVFLVENKLFKVSYNYAFEHSLDSFDTDTQKLPYRARGVCVSQHVRYSSSINGWGGKTDT
jgi:hypothetical protein